MGNKSYQPASSLNDVIDFVREQIEKQEKALPETPITIKQHRVYDNLEKAKKLEKALNEALDMLANQIEWRR